MTPDMYCDSTARTLYVLNTIHLLIPPSNPPIRMNGDYLQQIFNEQCCGVEPENCNIEFDKYLVLRTLIPPPSPPVSVLVQLDISSASDYPEPGVPEVLQLV